MLVRRARIIAFLIFGLSGGADASQEGKDMKLEDMGFVMRAADTPAVPWRARGTAGISGSSWGESTRRRRHI